VCVCVCVCVWLENKYYLLLVVIREIKYYNYTVLTCMHNGQYILKTIVIS